MNILIILLLGIHIVAGMLALVSAPIAIILRNKTPRHRIAGRVYFYSMLAVTATALVIAVYKNIPFLFLVGIFSFYAIWDARRSLALKFLHEGQKAKWYDWVVGLITLLFDTLLVIYGIYVLTTGNSMGWVALVFGGIGLFSVSKSLIRFTKRPTDPKHWLYRHLQGMLAGYIATVTAFMAVNITFLPPLVVWLLPTVVGSAVITYLMFRIKGGKEHY